MLLLDIKLSVSLFNLKILMLKNISFLAIYKPYLFPNHLTSTHYTNFPFNFFPLVLIKLGRCN